MSSEGSQIFFRRAPGGLQRDDLRRFARVLQDEVAGGQAFQCLITDDRELRRLNRTFLGKDDPTDVLSFPEADGLGEIAISAQRAAAQARRYGHALQRELEILMLHGLLHLLGMDHERDRGRMARVEADWRLRLGLPAGLIERARS